MILRRGRGRVPGTLPLPPGFEDAPDTLALGGDLKGAICLTKGGQALLSHHLGDMNDALSFAEARKAVADYRDLFDHAPALLAADLHKGYRATGLAAREAARDGTTLVHVQHHHAHLAACLGEHLWPRDGGKVAGIVLDGLGLGTDGTIWGGEVLLGDYAGYTRAAWLRPAPLIGGDAASRAPWRNLLARLDLHGLGPEAEARLGDKPLSTLRHAVRTGTNSPLSSSAGRLFDAFASALGIAPDTQGFEGEAAMALEALALRARAEDAAPYLFGLDAQGGAMDDAPLWSAWARDMANGVPPEVMAQRFHAGLAQSFAAQARALVARGAASAIVLSGGCFQNALLLELTRAALSDLPVLWHEHVPANDGGLALGQALVAMAGGGAGR
jgi:hydrogenase maturation protein HypF